MAEAAIIGAAIVWLGLGGWAFATLMQNGEKPLPSVAVSLFGLCVVLGPFCAGCAVAVNQYNRRSNANA